MKYNILICDDDIDILSALEIYLKTDGYNVIKSENGQEVLKVVKNETVHLILLDIMMPIMDGLQTAVKLREFTNIPIIFLSAKSEETDKILGLNIGADDYITKPFNPIELLARVKATVRRYSLLGGMEKEADVNVKGVFKTGDLILDDNLKQVIIHGENVSLTAIEYRILKLLISNLERVFSSEQIYENVWGEPSFNTGKTVSVHIRNIREKIEFNPTEPDYLKVVYGFGYKVVKKQ